jgi:hypothetical protein
VLDPSFSAFDPTRTSRVDACLSPPCHGPGKCCCGKWSSPAITAHSANLPPWSSLMAEQRKRIALRIRELQPAVSNRAIARTLDTYFISGDRLHYARQSRRGTHEVRPRPDAQQLPARLGPPRQHLYWRRSLRRVRDGSRLRIRQRHWRRRGLLWQRVLQGTEFSCFSPLLDPSGRPGAGALVRK